MPSIRQLALALAAGTAMAALAGPAMALDEVTFGTNWLPEAEHGGFYQAVADGTYEKYGLKVTIEPGGPQKDTRAPLLAGKIQFYMSGNMLVPLQAPSQGVPVLEVAAIFQKEPQVLLVHPDTPGIDTFADLAKLPTLFMSQDGFQSYFQWMKQAYPGFKDEQYKPYNFDPQVFIVDKNSAMQGYITSEPYAVQKAAGFKPKEFLLADSGFVTPSTMIEVLSDYAAKNPDIVQRFVDASIIGWYNYLYGDPSKGNAAIKAANPEMTDEYIAYSIAKMKEVGLVDSGVAAEKGIGCFSDDNQKTFYDEMAKAKVVPEGVDISKTYTNQFVCKKVGMDLKK
ncbi:MAG TPA: ABC transporter substrate-binding protein [Bauldia sp.]|nr:ABC transporter substrate-binding protein [Bauldia sp.]